MNTVIPESSEAAYETGFFSRFHELAELDIWNPALSL